MRIITQNDINKELLKGLQNPPRRAIVDYINNQVNYGYDEKPNFEYCKNNNIDCVDIGRRGGAFVVNKGDVGVGLIVPNLDNTEGELIYHKFVEYLKNKWLNAEAVSNDILIDGYKVFGWSSNYYSQYNATFISIHFTMSANLELIKKVCIKPMNKVPKGLSEFGVTRNEVLQFLNSELEHYTETSEDL